MHLDPAAVTGALAVLAQEPSAFTAETVAARPDQVARGFRFLMAAYTAVWIILALYLLSLSIRLRRLATQVRRLKERLGLSPDAPTSAGR